MAKAKEFKATTKKKDASAKKAQPSKVTKSKTFNLSEEKVVDSGSEDEAPAAKSPAKTKSKSKEVVKKSNSSVKATPQKAEPKSKPEVKEQQKEASESDSEESSEEESDTKHPAPKQVPAKTNGVKRKAEESSEESEGEESTSEEEPPAKKAKTSPEVDVHDSSSEEDGESSGEEEVAKTPVVKTKKVEPVPEVDMQDSSSEEDDGSEESEEEEPQPTKVKSKETKQAAKAKPAAESKTQESSEEEESSSAEERKVATKRKDKPAPTTGKASIESIPAKPFEPPSGYVAIEPSSLSSSSPFAFDNFAGKQIWHIIAPSNVPLKSITEVALDAVKSSTPVLNHKGVDYILAADNSHSTKFDAVFIPSNLGYRSVGQHVDTTLQLQQKIELPNLSKLQADVNKGSSAAANIAQAAISDARPQPKGLRMRYKPPGFGRGTPGRLGSESESSSDDDASLANKTGKSLQFPKALGAHGASDKPDSSNTPVTAKSKPSKKKRKDSDVEMIDASLSMPPPESVTPRKKKKQAKEVVEETPSAKVKQEAIGESPSGAKEDSKEEKAKKKEMKRLKKEAKKSA